MILTPHQRQAAEAFLAEQSIQRQHVVVALSGAHAYGFPSPDSDLDLKGIHIAPTRRFLGLHEPETVADVLRTDGGVELDYSSNELGPVLRGLLAGNGNYLERILGEHLLARGSLLDELQPLAEGLISKRFHRHYRGFAHQQRKAVEADPEPPAKRMLYVLRTALTGTELLRTGTLVVDLRRLLAHYGHEDAEALIERKQRGELSRLTPEEKAAWTGSLDRAFADLDEALAASPLPDAPDEEPVRGWLVDARIRKLTLEVGEAARA